MAKGMILRSMERDSKQVTSGESVEILRELPSNGYLKWYMVKFPDGTELRVNGHEVRAYSKSGLTPLQERRIIETMNHVWQEIGGDWLQACGIEETSGKTIPRSHVIEAVTDADRMTCQGNDHEAGELFYKLPAAHQKRLLREAFPYTRYGY